MFGNYQSTASLVIGMNKSVTNNIPFPRNMALLVLTSIVIICNNNGYFHSKLLSDREANQSSE